MTGILCCISLLLTAPDTFPAADTAFVMGKRQQIASVGKNVLQFEAGSGNMLNQELSSAGLSVRQYGPSGIGTLSRRGADPSQLQILWNGIVLNNPMLGMTDLGLLQSDASTRISLSEGGSGSFYGSGSVGGTLSLQHLQPANFGESVEASILSGSFGRIQSHADFRIRKQNSYLIWDNQWITIHNDFPYKIENTINAKMQFASRDQRKSRISAGFSHGKWDMSLHAEWQKGDRGLGTSTGGTTSLGNQADENKRVAVNANYQSSKFKWVQRLGLIQDDIVFQAPATLYPDSSRSQSLQYQQEWHFVLGGWNVITGADLWQVSGKTRAYRHNVEQLFPAQFISFFKQNNLYRIAASTRWEWHERLPVNSISAEYALHEVIRLKTSVNSSFRRPTLNDQYWSTGGNLNLKPEKGGNADAGLTAKWAQGQLQYDISATLWMRYLNNPIVWLPENNIWSASNMQRGDYYGTQMSALISGFFGKFRWQWQSGAEWCRATMIKKEQKFNALFVPRFSGASSVRLQRNLWSVQAGCHWQSMRFASTDNLIAIPGYVLFSLQAGKEIKYRQHKFMMSAGGDNIFNKSYEVMPGRPMPMRSLWLKANMNINDNNKKQ